jgi:hypothetical protein
MTKINFEDLLVNPPKKVGQAAIRQASLSTSSQLTTWSARRWAPFAVLPLAAFTGWHLVTNDGNKPPAPHPGSEVTASPPASSMASANPPKPARTAAPVLSPTAPPSIAVIEIPQGGGNGTDASGGQGGSQGGGSRSQPDAQKPKAAPGAKPAVGETGTRRPDGHANPSSPGMAAPQPVEPRESSPAPYERPREWNSEPYGRPEGWGRPSPGPYGYGFYRPAPQPFEAGRPPMTGPIYEIGHSFAFGGAGIGHFGGGHFGGGGGGHGGHR